MKRSVIQQIKALPPAQQDLFPEIRVEPEINVQVEPVFEVTTPPPDMTAFSDALKKLMIPAPSISVNGDRATKIELHFERDQRGYIKSPITIERKYED